ncbi:hypothetical protein ACM5SV_11930 [Rhizobium sp. CRRU65]
MKHASKIEKALKDRIPGIDLGSTISSESQAVKIFGLVPTNSEMRLKMFYWLGFGMIGVVFLTLLLATQNKPTTITPAITTSQNVQPGVKTDTERK